MRPPKERSKFGARLASAAAASALPKTVDPGDSIGADCSGLVGRGASVNLDKSAEA